LESIGLSTTTVNAFDVVVLGKAGDTGGNSGER
jgi:hypothetical protein